MEPLQSSTALSPTSLMPILSAPITTVTVLIVASIVAAATLVLSWNNRNLPHINPAGRLSPTVIKQLDFAKHGMEILNKAKKQFSGRVFRMIDVGGEVVVLPSRFANIIRNEEGLSFSKFVMHDFHTHLPGFQPIGILGHKGQVLQNLVRRQLTKLLNGVTEPLAGETTFAVQHIFGDSTEWKETLILDSLLDMIARLSSRVFLGDRLCRNEEWLKITKEYTADLFPVAQNMKLVPNSLKYLFPIFSKQCKVVYNEMRRAQEIIQPVIDERRALKEQALKEGKPVPTFNDSIDWAETECNGINYDPADIQLTLSFAAIHTTSDLLSKTMLLLANEPSLMVPLREEIVHVLKKDGWSKAALFNMKLVDSTIKEAQRMMPNDELYMHRIATKDVHFKEDNLTIRKGQHLVIDGTLRKTPVVCENPEKFDIYRWLRLRDIPEYANKAHFVSTSPEHLAFGHGMHACPGRFFAANEMKIALCFLLLKYDWQLAPGTTTELLTFGSAYIVNPKSTLRYRKREAEIDLEALEFS